MLQIKSGLKLTSGLLTPKFHSWIETVPSWATKATNLQGILDLSFSLWTLIITYSGSNSQSGHAQMALLDNLSSLPRTLGDGGRQGQEWPWNFKNYSWKNLFPSSCWEVWRWALPCGHECHFLFSKCLNLFQFLQYLCTFAIFSRNLPTNPSFNLE